MKNLEDRSNVALPGIIVLIIMIAALLGTATLALAVDEAYVAEATGMSTGVETSILYQP